ncbi:MAG: FecR domain-containing protein [Tannerellaceae bacterium]|nr:FecR domain-containing protein [Tannerellaceae bacterium]
MQKSRFFSGNGLVVYPLFFVLIVVENLKDMQEELDNYFLGVLNKKEKEALFDKIESDESYKMAFIRMQHTVALSRLYAQKNDQAGAQRMLDHFVRTVRNRQIRRRLWNVAKYAAVVLLLTVNGWLLTDRLSGGIEEEISYTTVEAPKGQRVSMILQDGTEVWLSPRSTLRIPDRFNRKERSLELDGEGYFVVTRNEEKPFLVQTSQHTVKVVGTRFNVFAYSKSDRFETDLLDGKVKVWQRDRPEESLLLSPGEKAFSKNNRLTRSVSRFNNDEYLKNGVFSFNNKRFGEILEYLTLWYDIRFDIRDSAKKDLLVSGKFRQSDEVKNILKGLQGVHPFRYKEINEHQIEIY